ncbi:MAG: hypothetical protein AAGD25_26650 [Cyanobacteria bacterium P01_F01_bin.150]
MRQEVSDRLNILILEKLSSLWNEGWVYGRLREEFDLNPDELEYLVARLGFKKGWNPMLKNILEEQWEEQKNLWKKTEAKRVLEKEKEKLKADQEVAKIQKEIDETLQKQENLAEVTKTVAEDFNPEKVRQEVRDRLGILIVEHLGSSWKQGWVYGQLQEEFNLNLDELKYLAKRLGFKKGWNPMLKDLLEEQWEEQKPLWKAEILKRSIEREKAKLKSEQEIEKAKLRAEREKEEAKLKSEQEKLYIEREMVLLREEISKIKNQHKNVVRESEDYKKTEYNNINFSD